MEETAAGEVNRTDCIFGLQAIVARQAAWYKPFGGLNKFPTYAQYYVCFTLQYTDEPRHSTKSNLKRIIRTCTCEYL
jgi:hypothetical protein